MRKIYFRFIRYSSKKTVLLSLFALELLFMYAFHGLFSFSVEKLQHLSGGYGIPDALFYYRFDTLQTLFSHYGEAGKKVYLQLQVIDMIYPLIYSTLLAGLLYLQFSKSRLTWVIIIPHIAALFDYAENLSLRFNLIRFPSLDPAVADASGIFTCLKWSLVYLSILLLLIAWFKRLFFKKPLPQT